MGEIGTNLLRRTIAEQAREQSTIRDAAPENKFQKLPNPTSPRNDKQVHNLSSKELTKDQMQVLRHEASFNTADAKPANMIAAVESILCQTQATEETKNLIRHQVSSLLMAHRPREVLSKVERDALRELKADKDLVIVPADNGRATVVLGGTDYLQKAKGLLEDRQFYVPCATNPLKALTREINATSQHNISSKQLTPKQLKVLSHEACFNTDPVNLMATVESILKQTGEPDEATHLIRQQVTSLLMAHKSRAIITKAKQNALKALRNDTSIVILPADKRRSTVVLDKTDYVQKANALLEDRQAYLPCGEESIKTVGTQLQKTLAEMQSNRAISKSVRLTIKPTDAAAARSYGLPKVHKPGLPLRPIVSLRGTPTYNLAKWLFRKLRSLTLNAATTVCSAAQFLERLKGIRLSDNEVMVSLLSSLRSRNA
nr:unnamed protein product [Spirometra erinaceieuropaei]